MKRLIVLLCALYLVLDYGTAFAAWPQLNDIPPSWSKTLRCDTAACPRFELVLGGAAVLDHETGLVWEKEPNPNPWPYAEAAKRCARSSTGFVFGWHLPTREQLTSLWDYAALVSGGLRLPPGHPFDTDCSAGGCVQPVNYWTSSTYPDDPTVAWVAPFGGLDGLLYIPKSGFQFNAWCVRGGQTYQGD
jgi:hypothetical protein